MIGDKIQAQMTAQIGEEFDSAYLYLSMVAYFESKGLDGMASWMKAQTTEEIQHGMKFFAHIHERGGHVELPGLKKPQAEWPSPLAAFQAALGHEQYITAKINDLMDLAIQEKDHAAQIMLQWFVAEQVEEEESVQKVLDVLERIGESGHGLIMLDRELRSRAMPVTLPAGGE